MDDEKWSKLDEQYRLLKVVVKKVEDLTADESNSSMTDANEHLEEAVSSFSTALNEWEEELDENDDEEEEEEEDE